MQPTQPATVAVASGTIRSDGPDVTRAIGHALGREAQPGTLLALVGPLGAGKTQLAKGVAQGLGITGVVNSPTFVLMNEHQGRIRMHHVDAYRLDDPADAVAAGLLDERGAEGVVVVEWADRLTGWLPEDRLEIELAPLENDSARSIGWRAIGDAHVRLARAALGES